MTSGTVLGDRYELEELIATGGMGQVYAAHDRRIERNVAVKLLRDNFARDDALLERFRREARAAGALSHPNIAAVYDYGEDLGEHYIVMERCKGHDLSEVIRKEGALEPHRAARIGAQIAAALEHAHAAGVIHRDIKPSNVIIDEHDRVKVMDFGIARAAGESTLTGTGLVLGSAHYIAPEQASGEPATAQTDLYSLGVVLFELLTAEVPFTGDSPIGIAVQHLNDDIPSARSVNAAVPPELDAIVARATEKDPRARYASASEMGAALTAAATGEELGPGATQVLSPTTTVWPIPGATWNPQTIGRAALIGFLALFLLAAGLLLFGGDPEDRKEKKDRAGAPAGSRATEDAPQETSTSPEASSPTLQELRGKEAKDVMKILQDAGFVVHQEKTSYEGFDKGIIVGTDPPAGTVLEPGQTITLFVSDGKDSDKEEDD